MKSHLLAKIAALEAEQEQLESEFTELDLEIEKLVAEWGQLMSRISIVAFKHGDNDLLAWIADEADKGASLTMRMNKMLNKLGDENQTDPGQDLENTRLQLEHLIAIQKEANALWRLRRDRLKQQIKRAKEKLARLNN